MCDDVSQAYGTDTNISSLAYPGPYPLGLNRTQAQTGLSLSLASLSLVIFSSGPQKERRGPAETLHTPGQAAVHRKSLSASAFQMAGEHLQWGLLACSFLSACGSLFFLSLGEGPRLLYRCICNSQQCLSYTACGCGFLLLCWMNK